MLKLIFCYKNNCQSAQYVSLDYTAKIIYVHM